MENKKKFGEFKTPTGVIYDIYVTDVAPTRDVRPFRFDAIQRGGRERHSLIVNFSGPLWAVFDAQNIPIGDRLEMGARALGGYILQNSIPEEITISPGNLAEFHRIPSLDNDEAKVLIQLYRSEKNPFNIYNVPTSLRLLAQYLGWNEKKTITVCEKLISKDLIQSIPSPNSQPRFYKLSSKGHELVQKL